jgi:carboxyl-terminal processing protease
VLSAVSLALSLLAAARAEEPARPSEIARELIEESSLAEIDSAALEQAAISGMLDYLESLEVCSGHRLLEPADLEARKATEKGVREGIGAEYRIVPWRGLMITEVPPGSAAQRAGLQPGQSVVSVHGEALDGRGPQEIADLVRRQSSGLLELEVEEPDGSRRVLLLPRSRYQLRPVRLETDGAHNTILVKAFSQGTAEELARILEELDGAPVVLDLRDNPGGDLVEAVAAADLFLPMDETLGFEQRRRTGTRPFVASRPALHDGSVVVLINGGTRGTAELFAAALQETRRAPLVGTHTGGLACDTNVYVLPGGLSMELADVSYAGPGGRSWQNTGLTPDVEQVLYPEDAPPAAVARSDRQLEAARRILGEEADTPENP